MAKKTTMHDDLEMERQVIARNQEQSDLDSQDRRGGPFPPWYLDKLAAKRQTPDGSEIPDPTVMEPPIGHTEMPSIIQSMYELIQQEKIRSGDLTYMPDTPEEADDFDVDDSDDVEPISAYEFERNFEPPQTRSEDPTKAAAPVAANPPADGPNVPKTAPSGQEVPLTAPSPKQV